LVDHLNIIATQQLVLAMRLFGGAEAEGGSGLLTSLMLALGIMLVITSLMMGIRKRRRRAGQTLSPREQVERLKQQGGMRHDLESLMVEIEQLAKRLGAQLDAKTVQLERLLDEADSRMAAIQTRLQANRSNPPARDPAPFATAPAPDTAAVTTTDSAARPNQPDAPANPSASDLAAKDQALRQSIYDLTDQGRSPVQIAQQLDEHVGKVELILALRNAR
jgi:hypothetical protein